MSQTTFSPEHERLRDVAWKNWGPYMAERSWANLREDSAVDSQPWANVPFDHARSLAFRWAEDGLAGFSDSEQQLCMAVAFWNERDAILKERLFGLTNEEGNHGEDVKELYVLLDGLPSHAYMKALYKYPQVAFPYAALREQNAERSRDLPEAELFDVLRDALAETRYFDVMIEYAKAGPTDIFCRITAINRGPEPASLHVLPHLWFRNTWAHDDSAPPQLEALDGTVSVNAPGVEPRYWYATCEEHAPRWLFTDNETNAALLYGGENRSRYTKDGIGDAVVLGKLDRINPARCGTRAAAHFSRTLAPGASVVVTTRLCDAQQDAPFADADAVFAQRSHEADQFYAAIQPVGITDDERRVQRQAFAGLCWSKMFYHFEVGTWLAESEAKQDGDSDEPPLNAQWRHVYAKDIVSVPDKWEYPWFAAWDQVFQSITIGLIDSEFAKQQVALLASHRYQHPNGQLPGFEGHLDMTNPPVHAWGALHVFSTERRLARAPDMAFLKHIYQKLLLNYSWWFCPQGDATGSAYEGGFLGMDNISVFDRSGAPPGGGALVQADSYGWMGLFTLNMLEIAVELAQDDPTHEDEALHFVNALERLIDSLHGEPGDDPAALLWDDEDGFFYDVWFPPQRNPRPLRVRSYVGLIPFVAVAALERDKVERLPQLKQRLDVFADRHGGHLRHVTVEEANGEQVEKITLALVRPERVERILERLTDRDEFLSDFGLRSLSRVHARSPFVLETEEGPCIVEYEPAESRTELVGGNSNWRGPIWAPINLLVIEALRHYEAHFSGTLTTTLDGETRSAGALADHLCRVLVSIFLRGEDGRRPVYGDTTFFHEDPHWGDAILFYEHFHGDRGFGLGASYQNGWTALIAKLIQDGGAV